MRTPILIVLAAIVAIARTQGANKILMSPLSAVIDKASTVKITFTLTEPIICNDPHAYCGVTVLLTNANPKQITMSSCHVEWTRERWSVPQNVTIQAVENFVDDGQMSFSVITEPAQSESEFYNGYDLPNLNMTTKSRPAGQCSSVTDPHIFQFDGGQFIDVTAGTFLLWGAPQRDFEVQTRVTNGRNCGVAIRDSCDLLIIDRCSGSLVIRPYFKTTDGLHPIVAMLSDKSTCTVSFPRSGASIKVNFVSRVFQVGNRVCGWSGCFISYTSHTEYWIDVFCTAPGADWGYMADNVTPRTRGLCGSFDSNRNNDPKLSDVSKHLIPNGQSWFEKPVSCTPYIPPPVNYSRCAYVPPKIQIPVISNPDSEIITDLLKSIVIRQDDPRVVYQFNATNVPVPTYTAADEARVEAFCTNAVVEAPAAKHCQAIGVDLQKFIASCQLDILYQDDYTLVDGSIQAMKEECHFVAIKNISLYDIAEDGSLIVSEKQKNLGSLLACPNDCSFHGTCSNGTCICDPGFTGADCFTNATNLPILNRLIPFQYDARSSSPAPAAISLVSDSFVANAVQCKIDGIVSQVTYLSVNEILCHFPANYTNNGAVEKFVNVSFSNDGERWAAPLVFTFFDSGCRQCTELGVCTDKPNSCKINGKCYAPNDISPQNPCLTCQPSRSITAFNYAYTNGLVCGPVFAQPNYVQTVPEDQRISVPFVTVNAKNPLVANDASNVVTYSIVSTDSPFSIGSSTGAVALTSSLNYVARNTYSVILQAVDSAGNSATVSFVVNVLEINKPPFFNPTSYSFSLAEGLPTSTLGVLTATNLNTNSNGFGWDKITYSLNSFQFPTFTSAFSIDPATGVLKTVAPLNYAQRSIYTFNVSATNGGGLSGSAIITVTLLEVNKPPTFIGLTSNSIDENSPENTIVGTLYSEDRSSSQSFTYTLASNADGRFKLVTTDGVTSLVTGPTPIDYEFASNYFVNVTSTDNGVPPLSLTLTLDILANNINEAPVSIHLFAYPTWNDSMPDPSSPTTTTPAATIVSETPLVTLSEATLPGIVATLTTDDPDVGQSYTYVLTSNPGNYFQISSNLLVLAKPLSYQTTQSITLKIVSTDSGSPAISTPPISFTISITNANEPPTSVAFTAPVSVSELATVGTQVGTVTGRADPNRNFVFSIDDPTSKFAVGITTCSQVAEGTRCQAVVTLKAALRFKTAPVETVIMTATVTINNMKSITNLYVNVIDMSPTSKAPVSTNSATSKPTGGANVPPVLVAHTPSTIVKVKNDARVGSVVFSVSSTPSDVVFTIQSGNGLGLLQIDSQTGVISVAVLPYESSVVMNQSPIPIVIKAISSAGMSSTIVVMVQFIDNCFVNPCENDGVCIDRIGTYKCSCMPGYEGTNCDIPSEIVPLIDAQASTSSSSVSSGTAAGVAIAVVAFVVLAAVVVVFVMRRKQGKTGIAPASISNVLYESVDSSVPSAALLGEQHQMEGRRQPTPEYSEFAPVTTTTDIFVPGTANPLYSWYQPETTKEDCVSQLASAECGSFIVRDFTPTPGWHMLVMRTPTDVVSEKIRQTPEGLYQLVGETIRTRSRLPSFASIPQLVQHYASGQQTDLPVVLTVSNPIYDNSNLVAHGRPRQVVESDEARPALPLRDHEALTASVVAHENEENSELYLNQIEARAAVAGRHASISLRETSDSAI